MGMILTDDDLQAIKQTLAPIIIEAVDQLAQATAAGFEDVQQQIYNLQNDVEGLRNNLKYSNDKLENIERVQQAEVQRSDHHDLVFRKMSQALKSI